MIARSDDLITRYGAQLEERVGRDRLHEVSQAVPHLSRPLLD